MTQVGTRKLHVPSNTKKTSLIDLKVIRVVDLVISLCVKDLRLRSQGYAFTIGNYNAMHAQIVRKPFLRATAVQIASYLGWM